MYFLRNLINILNFIYNHPLNRGHKFKSILNFVRWQMGSILIQKKAIIPWVDDSKFIIGRGESGLTGNLYTGFMEFEDMAFLLHALQPMHKFIDVGANIGAYTILAAKVVKAQSVAFEPLPETADKLMDQIKINRIEKNTEIKNMGVGSKPGVLRFTNNKDTMNKVLINGDSTNSTEVMVTTLDIEVELDKPIFLKIDVEGFEYDVIEGASSIISSEKFVALIIELNGSGNEFGHTNEDIHERLCSFNLTPVSYDPFTRSISKLDWYNKNNGNTIYVRDIEGTIEACKKAPKRVIHTANDIMI